MAEHHISNGVNGNNDPAKLDTAINREVIHCAICGLVQFRTRMGNCRRCLRLMQRTVEFLTPPAEPQELPADNRPLFQRWPNHKTVEKIGQRIQELRESRRMTQTQLRELSQVSRSYLSRIESGLMTPSLGTLEKISEALGVGLNRFFVPVSNSEALLEDPFIHELRPLLHHLDWDQWQSILKCLGAISSPMARSQNELRPLQPQPVRMDDMTCQPTHRAAIGHR